MRSLTLFVTLLLVVGCRRARDGVAPVDGAAAGDATPGVPFVVRDDSQDLLLFWFDPGGIAHAVRALAEVPVERRALVRVDPSRPELRTPGWVYVADLSARRADGTYPTRALPAERLATAVLAMAGHRDGLGSAAVAARARAAPSPEAGRAAETARPAVIIYGASWCTACHQAADYLRRRNIAFVEKDIERDPAAAQEMADKARRAGVPTGSIPIIDVRGRIMAGFSAPAIEAALRG